MSNPVPSLALDNYAIGTHPGAGVQWPSGATQCAMVPTMDETTGADTTKSGEFGFDISSDNQNWSPVSYGPWQGGPNTKQNLAYSLPAISNLAYPSPQTPPAFVRAVWITVSGSVSVGLALQFS